MVMFTDKSKSKDILTSYSGFESQPAVIQTVLISLTHLAIKTHNNTNTVIQNE